MQSEKTIMKYNLKAKPDLLDVLKESRYTKKEKKELPKM